MKDAAEDSSVPLWISWETHRRTLELARFLGIEPVVIDYDDRLSGVRYFISTLRTIGILVARRPTVLLVQSPSLLLALLATVLKPVFRYRLIVDAHNSAVRPAGRLRPVYRAIARLTFRAAHRTIVTNTSLAADVAEIGGVPFVLPDPLPSVVPQRRRQLKGERNVLYICTFADDEPYEALIRAAECLPRSCHVYVTGRRDRIPERLLLAVAPNVEFTGFLPDDDYWELLESVDLVVDLTYRDDCLVCGAYEAVARGKPLVLSDTAALRGYFSAGTVYTANTAEDIRLALHQALTRLDELISEMRRFRTHVGAAWAGVGEAFRIMVFGAPAAPFSGEH